MLCFYSMPFITIWSKRYSTFCITYRTSLLHEKAETFFSHTESTVYIYFGSPFGYYPTFHTLTSVGRKHYFQYVKRMFPLFLAIVKFCSTNRLFTYRTFWRNDNHITAYYSNKLLLIRNIDEFIASLCKTLKNLTLGAEHCGWIQKCEYDGGKRL